MPDKPSSPVEPAPQTQSVRVVPTCCLCGAVVTSGARHACPELTGTSSIIPWASGPRWKDDTRPLPAQAPRTIPTEADLEEQRARERREFVPPPPKKAKPKKAQARKAAKKSRKAP